MEKARTQAQTHDQQGDPGAGRMALAEHTAQLPSIVNERKVPGKISVPVFDRRTFFKRTGQGLAIGAAMTTTGTMLAACDGFAPAACEGTRNQQFFVPGEENQPLAVGNRKVELSEDKDGKPSFVVKWQRFTTKPKIDISTGQLTLSSEYEDQQETLPFGRGFTWKEGNVTYNVTPGGMENGKYTVTYATECPPTPTAPPPQEVK